MSDPLVSIGLPTYNRPHSLRTFLGKIRQKILRKLLGRNLYANAEQVKILENRLTEQCRLSLYRSVKYAPESKYPEIVSDRYCEVTGKKLDLNNPRTFNEKIQWLKLYDCTPLKTRLADKFLVRDFVKEKIGEEYLVPLLGVYDSFDEIDFDGLPDRFVLKANHGSGWNIIVKNKAEFNKEKAKRDMDYWMRTNFAYFGLELHYRDIEPRIIAEQYLEDNVPGDLPDYKFLCFCGEPKYIWVDIDRYTNHKRDIYDLDWNKQPFSIHYPNVNKLLFPPGNLNEMVRLAKILCEGFLHVRIDFYSICSKIYFGEITFTPDSGKTKIEPDEWNLKLGDMIKLPFDKEVKN